MTMPSLEPLDPIAVLREALFVFRDALNEAGVLNRSLKEFSQQNETCIAVARFEHHEQDQRVSLAQFVKEYVRPACQKLAAAVKQSAGDAAVAFHLMTVPGGLDWSEAGGMTKDGIALRLLRLFDFESNKYLVSIDALYAVEG